MPPRPPESTTMPAEWEPHEATWLSWPHNADTWPGRLERIPAVFAEIVAALHEDEEVRISVTDDALETSARRALRERGCESNVRFFHVPTNDAWARDHAPIFVHDENGDVVALDWGFNAWGGKYPPWDLDDAVPARIASALGLPAIRPGMILEGGSIDGNGAGSLLTTESCLLNPNRNRDLGRAEIEERLRRHLGCEQILWLRDGIAGDDTDGHIDDISRFVSPRTILTMIEEDPADPNYRVLLENLRALYDFRNPAGEPFEIVTLPMPAPVRYRGERLPASYANFYVGNGAVLLPVFGDPRDDVAIETLARLFPDRRIAPLRCEDLVIGLGGVHCVTQQQPAPRRRRN